MARELISLPFIFEGQEWPLKDLVSSFKVQPPAEPSNVSMLLSKPIKKAMKYSRQDQGIKLVSWEHIVRDASSCVPPPLLNIEKFTAIELSTSFGLVETSEHREARALVGRMLQRLEDLHWKNWGNPFIDEITRENCAEKGIPDYFLIIQNDGMSLTEMRRKFGNNGSYALAEFKKDFARIIENATTFNPPGEPVHNIAVDAKRIFDKMLDEEFSAVDVQVSEKNIRKRGPP
jgi:hypothetical protein